MTIPHENALAFFPQPVRAGNLELGPLTLAMAVRLGEAGIPFDRRIPDDLLFRAAWIMSGEHGKLPRFLRLARVGLQELSNGVAKVLNDAFATYIRPAAAGGGTVHLTPHGIGWPLEYAEFLCGEYGWSWQTAIETPVATVYALYAAYRQRHGGKHGLDYVERAYREELRKKAH